VYTRIVITHFFTNSREDDEKCCENRAEDQTSANHLYIACDRCTVAVTVEHGSSVTPEPLHSVKQNKHHS